MNKAIEFAQTIADILDEDFSYHAVVTKNIIVWQKSATGKEREERRF